MYALENEACFFQNSAGSDVVFEDAREDPHEIGSGERQLAHDIHRRRRDALAPEVLGQPIAELRRAAVDVFLLVETDVCR